MAVRSLSVVFGSTNTDAASDGNTVAGPSAGARQHVFVGNLGYDAKEADVRAAFAAYAGVSSVAIPVHEPTGKGRGYAFVQFVRPSDAKDAARGMDGAELNGR